MRKEREREKNNLFVHIKLLFHLVTAKPGLPTIEGVQTGIPVNKDKPSKVIKSLEIKIVNG